MKRNRKSIIYCIYVLFLFVACFHSAHSQPCQTPGVVFTESIGSVTATTSISSHETANGFDNDAFTMSGTGDIRNTNMSSGYGAGNPTASGNGNAFLTNTVGRNFIISGINSLGDGNLELAFGIYKSTNTGTGSNGSDLQIILSTDGVNYTDTLKIATLPTGTGTTGWYYRKAIGNIPRAANLRIQFRQNGNITQYRIDDVKLSYGNTPVISAGGSTEFCIGNSVELSVSEAASYLWSTGETTQSIQAIASGNYSVTVNCIPSASIPVTVLPCAKIVQIKLYIEGFYSGSGAMNASIDPGSQPLTADSVMLTLHDTTNGSALISDTALLSTAGSAEFLIPSAYNENYYISVNQRNSLTVWSNKTISFNTDTVSYNFSVADSAPILNPVPILNTISPTSIVAGSSSFTLTVDGSDFINGSIIRWNGTNLSTIYISSVQLSATVPSINVSTAGTASISVFNPAPGGGTSSIQTFTTTTAPAPVPVLTSLSTNNTPAGSASFTLTASGSNFTNGSAIKWNGVSLTTTYISTTQLSSTITASLIDTAGTATVTIFTPAPGGGTSIGLTFTITAAPLVKKFLFDATKAETAGNADWVIDQDASPQRFPTPSQSTVTANTSETYWNGAISAFGIDIVKSGNAVETLPAGTAITYGNSSNAQDLSNYHVFVLDEPNIVFTAAEKTAILNFVNNGGGLFFIVDHINSDRNNDGWDSPEIYNDFINNNSIATNPFGITVDLNDFSVVSSNVRTNSSTNAILNGPYGAVTQLEFNNGASLTLNTTANSSATGLIWRSNVTQNNSNLMCASSTYGQGRIFIVGDSSPIDDGTGAAGNTLFDGYSVFSHKKLFMNAALWLAKLQ